jgi:hypothetical protein
MDDLGKANPAFIIGKALANLRSMRPGTWCHLNEKSDDRNTVVA